MSYKYGLNGNDVNWDAMMSLNYIVEDLELAIFNEEIELDEDGNIPEDVYEGYMDGNPTCIYYDGKEVDIQQMLKDEKKLDEFVDWYIIHDTNDNFVTFVGEVPDKYLTDKYIKERNEAEAE